MNDDVCQQWLHASEQRVARRRTTDSGHKEGQEKEMTEGLAASSARNVRPRSAETSSRMEDVLPSRK